MQACTICSPALGAAAASDTQWPRQALSARPKKNTTAQTHFSSYPARTQLKNLQFMAKEKEGQLFSFSNLVGVRYQALQRLHLLVDLAPPPLRPKVNQIKQGSSALARRTQKSTMRDEKLKTSRDGKLQHLLVKVMHLRGAAPFAAGPPVLPRLRRFRLRQARVTVPKPACLLPVVRLLGVAQHQRRRRERRHPDEHLAPHLLLDLQPPPPPLVVLIGRSHGVRIFTHVGGRFSDR